MSILLKYTGFRKRILGTIAKKKKKKKEKQLGKLKLLKEKTTTRVVNNQKLN